ncbi:MAG: hypothetical protein ACK4WB_05365 [Desulfatiglandales bacterium]
MELIIVMVVLAMAFLYVARILFRFLGKLGKEEELCSLGLCKGHLREREKRGSR